MDAEPIGDIVQVERLVREFIAQLWRNIAEMRECTLVPIVECNNNEILASHIFRLFGEFSRYQRPVQYMRDLVGAKNRKGGLGRYAQGVYTTDRTKEYWVDHLNTLLRWNNIRFHEHFVTAARLVTPKPQFARPSDIKTELGAQLKRFCRIVEQSDSPLAAIRQGLTGKVGTLKDDIAVGVMLFVYYAARFYAHHFNMVR